VSGITVLDTVKLLDAVLVPTCLDQQHV